MIGTEARKGTKEAGSKEEAARKTAKAVKKAVEAARAKKRKRKAQDPAASSKSVPMAKGRIKDTFTYVVGRGGTARPKQLEHFPVTIYTMHGGLEKFAQDVRKASPLERVTIERRGMPARFVKHMADEMDIPATRLYHILGVPKATVSRLASANAQLSGAGGHAAVAMLTLIGEVDSLLAESTSDAAKSFDAAKWLGMWIERPQPALGGQKPADLLDTPTGAEVVSRILGSISSGAYQ